MRALRRSNDRTNSRLRAEDLLFFLGQLRPDLVQAACDGNASQLRRQGVEVVVINRVIFAGGIDYSFTEASETVARLALDLQSALPRQPQSPQAPTLGSAAPVPSTSTANMDASTDRLTALAAAVTGDSGTSAGRAGVTTSLAIGTFGSLTLKQSFNRLVAVGAGSRVRVAFHDMLAGADDDPIEVEKRSGYATRYCHQAFGAGFDPLRLVRALRMNRLADRASTPG